MRALDAVVVHFPQDDAPPTLAAAPPRWFRRFEPGAGAGDPVDLGVHFLFLEHFVEEAREFWAEFRGEAGRLRSGLWCEPDPDGVDCHYQATAVCTPEDHYIILELLGVEFEKQRESIQRAREEKLDAHRTMNEQERATAILRSARDELEARVARRTAALTREMHEREAAEDRAVELRDQLTHVARLTTMGEMASGLAHELNQPLGAISNYLRGSNRLLEAGGEIDVPRIRDALDRAIVQADRAATIITRLREYVARGTPKRSATDVNVMVHEVVEFLTVETRHEGIDVRMNLTRDLPEVQVDRIQIQQVLVNLMRNAIQAMRGRDERFVEFATASTGDACTIAVTDSGPGCDEETRARLFDAWFTTKPEGLGIGLAICRSILDVHDGRIEAEPAPGGGLTFRIHLPCSPERSSHE